MGSKPEVVVVGAGHSGLTLSYHLKNSGVEHLVVDRAEHVADAWRNRWDSMSMLTPNWMNHLPGLEYPGDPYEFSTRKDTVRYLEDYARTIDPPLRLGVSVERLERKDDGTFALHTSDGVQEARQVVVAAGPFQAPRIPELASKLDPKVRQVHSRDYRNPDQFPAGSTIVVVGSGNSGCQIAMELTGKHKVTLAQGSNAKIPRRITGEIYLMARKEMRAPEVTLTDEEVAMEADFMWWMKRGEVWDQPVGSPFYYKIQDEGGNSDSYLGPDLEERAEALGFTLGDRLSEVNGTEVALADGIKVTPDVVLWATGWKRDFHWIDIPIFDETHMPRHTRGITDVPGLYFLGLRYLHTFSSHIILGAPRDAEYLAGQIKERAAH